MQYRESEFYKLILTLIDKDLESKNLKPIQLIDNAYIISRTQYYNIKKIIDGDKNTHRISHKRLMELCKYLEIKVNDILYDIDFSASKRHF